MSSNKANNWCILPIIIALIYEGISFSGLQFMFHQDYLMFALMVFTFTGLFISILSGGSSIWEEEDGVLSVVFGILIIGFSMIGSTSYYLIGTKYLGGTLSLILLLTYILQFIKNVDIRKNIIMILVLAYFFIICLIMTIMVPKETTSFYMETW